MYPPAESLYCRGFQRNRRDGRIGRQSRLLPPLRRIFQRIYPRSSRQNFHVLMKELRCQIGAVLPDNGLLDREAYTSRPH